MEEITAAEEITTEATAIDPALVEELTEALQTASRRERQHVAAKVYEVAKRDPAVLVDHIDLFIDSLNRPEAQTRWELLETLTLLVDYDARACAKAIPEAEASLFDEESGLVRLSAMRFLCKLGIQCYHGDLEFNDMLVALLDFSKGKLSDPVKKEFADRMSFDAENSKGTLKKRAQTIIENLK